MEDFKIKSVAVVAKNPSDFDSEMDYFITFGDGVEISLMKYQFDLLKELNLIELITGEWPVSIYFPKNKQKRRTC